MSDMSLSSSDSDEANFQRTLRATQACIDTDESDESDDSPGDGESEDDF